MQCSLFSIFGWLKVECKHKMGLTKIIIILIRTSTCKIIFKQLRMDITREFCVSPPPSLFFPLSLTRTVFKYFKSVGMNKFYFLFQNPGRGKWPSPTFLHFAGALFTHNNNKTTKTCDDKLRQTFKDSVFLS